MLTHTLVIDLLVFGAAVGTAQLIMWLTDWQPIWVILTVMVVAFGSRSWFESRHRRASRRGVVVGSDADRTTRPRAQSSADDGRQPGTGRPGRRPWTAAMNRPRLVAPTTAAALFVLTACASGGAAVEDGPSATPPPHVDVTDDVLGANDGEPWTARVTAVASDGRGRLEVSTSITAPVDGDSTEAVREAIEVCDGALDHLGDEATFVVVLDDDGRQIARFASWEVAEGTSGGGCTEHVLG
jgi:hypothetical protein